MSKVTVTLREETEPLHVSGNSTWGSPTRQYLSLRRGDTDVDIFVREWLDLYPLLAALQNLIGSPLKESVRVFELRHYRSGPGKWEHVGLFSNLERAQGEGLEDAKENYGAKFIKAWMAPFTPGVYSSVPNWRLHITDAASRFPMYDIVERELHS